MHCKGRTLLGTDCAKRTRDKSGYCCTHIDQQPKIVIEPENKENDTIIEKCSICIEPLVGDILTLSCKHSTHYQCFQKYVNTSNNNDKCVLCRKKVEIPIPPRNMGRYRFPLGLDVELSDSDSDSDSDDDTFSRVLRERTDLRSERDRLKRHIEATDLAMKMNQEIIESLLMVDRKYARDKIDLKRNILRELVRETPRLFHKISEMFN